MGVFHWNQLVGNYGFFEDWELCLQTWLGSVKVSRLVMMDRLSWKPFCGEFPGLSDTLSVLPYTVSVLSGSTSRPVVVPEHHIPTGRTHQPTIREWKPACHKHNQPVLVTSCQDNKFPSLRLLSW